MTIRDTITKAGGLATSAGLAARWGVTRQAVDQMKGKPGFPAGIEVQGSGRAMMVYPVAEADEWKGTT